MYSKDGTVAQIDVPTPGNGTDAPSTAARARAAGRDHPATIEGVGGATVNVSGDAAGSEDFNRQLSSRLPLIFAFVFGLAFLLMLVTFRSSSSPSRRSSSTCSRSGPPTVFSSWSSRRDRGESLLGFTSNGGVDELATAVPVRCPFRTLDGLPRLHPLQGPGALRAGLSTDEAVKQAISSTAGTVTSAAIVMVGVFFSVHDPQLPRLQGVRARVGRGGPDRRDDHPWSAAAASMKLLGDWNWYLPSWLDGSRGSRPIWTPRACRFRGGAADSPSGVDRD